MFFTRRSAPAIPALLLAALLVACGGDDDDPAGNPCKTTLTPATLAASAAGTVTVTGTIHQGESTLLRYPANGVTLTATGLQSGSQVRFIGLPAGTYEVVLLVSCDDAPEGEDIRGRRTITVP